MTEGPEELQSGLGRPGQGWDPKEPCASPREPVTKGGQVGECSKNLKAELRTCRRKENLPPCCVTLDL